MVFRNPFTLLPRYSLQLKVDGEEVSTSKSIEYRDHETPYLNGIVNK